MAEDRPIRAGSTCTPPAGSRLPLKDEYPVSGEETCIRVNSARILLRIAPICMAGHVKPGLQRYAGIRMFLPIILQDAPVDDLHGFIISLLPI